MKNIYLNMIQIVHIIIIFVVHILQRIKQTLLYMIDKMNSIKIVCHYAQIIVYMMDMILYIKGQSVIV